MASDPPADGPARDRAGGRPGGGESGDARVRVNRSLSIPASEVQWRATTPGGPGGQHANRTASRVEVRFDVEASPTLGPRQRALLLARLGPVVRASASEDRSQARNREIALERLSRRLAEGLRVAPARRPTSPTVAARRRRVEEKRRRGAVKRERGHRPGPED